MISYVAVGVLTVVVATLAVVALTTLAVPAVDESRSTLKPLPNPVERQIALFVGDSYTHGTGASAETSRWSSVVAASAGWIEINHGLGGTGYLTTADVSGCGRDFCAAYPGNLVAGTLGDAPSVIVIAGGQNDFDAFQADSETVSAAIHTTYAVARQLYPDARIIAVGPSTLGPVDGTVAAFDAAVQAAAISISAEYVSLIDPDVLDATTMDAGDGGHVNDSGHRAIAAAVLRAVGS